MQRTIMTRRRFLAVIGAATSVTLLGGCAPNSSFETPDRVSNGVAGEQDSSTVDVAADLSRIESAEDAEEMNTGKTLVVYFSNTGNTQTVAKKIAEIESATLFMIEPVEPYSTADLDYNNNNARCMRELNDPASRPAIAGTVADWDSYDTVFLGYPIWWGRTPPIMQNFVENYNWSAKTVVPFCTSGSSPIGQSANVLEAVTPGSTWAEGRRFTASASESDLQEWIEALGI